MNTSNGLFIDNNNLLIGNNADANIISVSLTGKTTKIIARSISGNIDEIKKYNESYLLTWRTELFILEPDNKILLLLQLNNKKYLPADFKFIRKNTLIIIPKLLTNKVIALKINNK